MTEPYEIKWQSSGRRGLARVAEKVATAIIEFLYGALAREPHRVGKPLTLTMAGLHAARRGDYRIIYRIDDPARQINVVGVGHRSDAYRPR